MSATIRLANGEDAKQVRAIYAPVVRDTAISFELEPPSVSEMRRRMEETIGRFPWLVCEDGADILGYAYAGAHRSREAYQWSVETSVYVHEKARRRGVGRALYSSLFALLALQRFHNIYAGITLPNDASVGLHEAMGFEPVGVYRTVGYKFASWHDVGWWQLRLQEGVGPPAPPMDFRAVRELPQWDPALTSGLSQLRR